MEATSVQQDSKNGTWIRRPWCVWTAAGLVVLGAVLNVLFLFRNCPFDLSEDEAHYWEWSRHLDYGYYSKPPGIAWVMWAAQHLGAALGLTGGGSGTALMPVLRLPAVIFGVCSGLLSLALARRMFRDDRAALAVIALSAAVPMFAVGSLLITIDAPMYLCWAATVYCLWRAVESGESSKESGQWLRPDRRPLTAGHSFWLYLAGLAAAAGMLFKPVLIALPACVIVAAAIDRGGPLRRTFLSRHALGALVVMLCSQIPVIIWNAHHHWVTLRHILTQGGMGALAPASAPAKSLVDRALLAPLSRVTEYIGGQAGGMGGIPFVLLVIAVVAAIQYIRKTRPGTELTSDHRPLTTVYRFLLSFTLPLWLFYFLLSFWKGTEVNWPAASYFTGMILLAGIFTEGWNAGVTRLRRAWRQWGVITIAWGVLLTAFVMNCQRLYGIAAEKLAPLEGTPAYAKSVWNPRNWVWERPLLSKLRGMDVRAEAVEAARQELKKETGTEPLLIGRRYGISSSLSFYLPDQPFVYCIMSNAGERESQYDLWPGLNDNPANRGKPAIIVANEPDKATLALLQKSFDRVEGPEQVPITLHGITVHDIAIYKAWGFRGLPASGVGGLY